ncbi:MAG: UDP-glucose 4-epimerase GalE [Rhodocyclaceae bacterium]|nr:UDP-glucose 4-epimerase GalE [Rhodocyclaceae bacterium]
MNILVVGGAGYIGSHMVRLLNDSNLAPVVLDDLSSGFSDSIPGAELYIGDVGDVSVLDMILNQRRFDAVMHFASFIQVGESVLHPAKYYDNNVGKTITLLNAMARHGVKNFIFSSSAAIFGVPLTDLVDEAHPQLPINPYGRSKWLVENLLPDYEVAYGIRHVCLRYFNAAGAQPDGSLGERHSPETHLVPLAINAALGRCQSLKVFGNDYPTLDGTCIRDYIHVCDLADAHLRALRHLRSGGCSLKLNLGNGAGYSVRQVLETVERQLGLPVPHAVVERRAGDPPILVADAGQAHNVLGWSPAYPDLDEIVKHAVQWHRAH